MPVISPAPSLLERLAQELQADIAARRLPLGTRLPSVRMLARERGVSPFTAAAVFERLVASGVVEARRGSGYFVASGSARVVFRRSRDVPADSLWESRDDPQASLIRVDAGCGWLPSDWLPHEAIRSALRAAGRGPGLNFGYASPNGSSGLREQYAMQLRSGGLDIDADRILTTQGASQALDLIVREFLEPNDAVVIEDPTYPPLLDMLRARQVKILAVRRGLDGPDAEQLEQLLKRRRPKLFFTNSVLHNPTGTSTSLPVAHRLLQLAERYDFNIVEDDIYAELAPRAQASLAVLDQCQRVLLVHSVSKTIAPDLRVGFVAAHPDVIKRLARAKTRASLASSTVMESLVLHILTRGHYRRHIETVRRRLAQAQLAVQQALEMRGVEWWFRPSGGMFLWGKLPFGLPSGKLWRLAADQGVLLAPGELFQVDARVSPYWRFNVAHADAPELYGFLDHLSDNSAKGQA